MHPDLSLADRRGALAGERLDTPVRDIMRPGVIVLSEDASVVQAQRALIAHGVHAVLVLERHNAQALGWVTSRGLLRWSNSDAGLVPVRNAVTEPPVAVHASVTCREALELLDRAGADRLLVTRGAEGLPEGVVAEIDLLRVLAC